MDNNYSKDGLYNLEAKDIFLEAKNLYQDFFAKQTAIKAFKLSIILYHLLEWIIPGCNEKSSNSNLENLKAKSQQSIISEEEQLLLDFKSSDYYKVLGSIANNSKHFKLTKSQSYEKGVTSKFTLGKSAVGEKLVQNNLFVEFEGKQIWLREVFNFVLNKYSDYFMNKI